MKIGQLYLRVRDMKKKLNYLIIHLQILLGKKVSITLGLLKLLLMYTYINGYFDFKPKTAKCIFRDFFTGLDYFFLKTGSLYSFSVVF